MNSNTIRKSARGALVAAVAILAPYGLAQAGELNLRHIGEHFPDSGGSTATAMDMSQYELLNLSAIGEKIWVAKPGAQGPMRIDADAQAQRDAADRDLRTRLGSVGGYDTN